MKLPAKIFFLFVLIATATFFAAIPVSADEGITILSPDIIPGGGEATFKVFFETIFAIAIGVAILAAVLMLVIAGVEYTAGGVSAEAKNDAKHRITAALSGLLLAFAAWLILNEVNPNILNIDVNLEELPTTVTTGGGGSGSTTPPTMGAGWYFIDTGGGTWKMSAKYLSQAECNQYRASFSSYEGCREVTSGDPRKYLNTVIYRRLRTAPGIAGVNRGDVPCLDGKTTNCTTVAELPERAIAKIKSLSQATGGGVIINGGTEPGHATHGQFKAIADIDDTPQVMSFLKTKSTTLTWPPKCAETVQHDGGTYTWEPPGCRGSTGNHWHVVW